MANTRKPNPRVQALKKQRAHNRLRNNIQTHATELLFDGIFWQWAYGRNTVANFTQLANAVNTTEYGIKTHWSHYKDDNMAQMALYDIKDNGELANEGETELRQHEQALRKQLETSTPIMPETVRTAVIRQHVKKDGWVETVSKQSDIYDTEDQALAALNQIVAEQEGEGADVIRLSDYAVGWGTDDDFEVIVAYPVTEEQDEQ